MLVTRENLVVGGGVGVGWDIRVLRGGLKPTQRDLGPVLASSNGAKNGSPRRWVALVVHVHVAAPRGPRRLEAAPPAELLHRAPSSEVGAEGAYAYAPWYALPTDSQTP